MLEITRTSTEKTKAKKIVVVMPAYNAAKTLKATYQAIDTDLIDEIILVDDHSEDATVEIAKELNITLFRHPQNLGYGGNQKTCYDEALKIGAEIVVMLHPDGQYDPTLLAEIVKPIQQETADLVLGSRMLLKGQALRGGMPVYKLCANKILTRIENLALKQSLSEYHTGYRAFSKAFLETIPYHRNSNDYVFDSEILIQAVAFEQRIAEIPITTHYFEGASSASFVQSLIYGLKTLTTLKTYLLHEWGIGRSKLFTQ
ncbi:glycosyltransferase family 2 protein [candidate division KSB1 bacterium]|nr:glycosyltransferase family 2 protein [candidate division KSB1 bacterium]NIR70964.1 glycosyltransferase family 2 protein [candidate division KSB1 bacterium]NIS24700.1 glycosyltransferase family 2 protein [candidate division KSB1 bacterium]NIT71609.1 glycosyltransferase family 2 protein [candidate division KSB1 bacterium]NIU25313.1 glycosyltransferase family 2 protein [candidate division KSB1 bacterium]